MKNVLIICIIFFSSCKKTNDVDEPFPFFPQHINDIPAIMVKNNIDSVFFIVEKGRINFSSVRDTAKIFRRDKNTNIVNSCVYGNCINRKLDNNGLEIFNSSILGKNHYYKWVRCKNYYLAIDSIIKDTVKYKISRNLITHISSKYEITNNFFKKNNKLIKTITYTQFGEEKIKTTILFSWKNDKLLKLYQSQNNDPSIKITYFDNNQFPIKEYIFKDSTLKDTIATVKIKHY